MPNDLLALDRPVVIAHRGGARLRPENTVAAFAHAATLGVDAIECDVHLSRDGEVVVIHDDTVDRTTNASGPVSAFTAAELAEMDAAWRFVDLDGRPACRQQGIGVPRLDDVLAQVPQLPFVIELKGTDTALVKPLLQVLSARQRRHDVVIGGFSQAVLEEVRRLDASLPTSASSLEVRRALRRACIGLGPGRVGYRLFQVPLRYRGRRVLGERFARIAQRAGLPVHAWVTDDAAEMQRLCSWGVTGLITDRPDVACALLRPAE